MIAPRKITNAAPGWVAPEYSSVCPFNADNSRLLLLNVDHFQLYDGDGNFIQDLPIGASERPRWSRNDPDRFTFLRENQFMEYRVSSSSQWGLRIFNEYASIDDLGEADQQAGARALIGTRRDGTRELFVFSIETNEKGPVLELL